MILPNSCLLSADCNMTAVCHFFSSNHKVQRTVLSIINNTACHVTNCRWLVLTMKQSHRCTTFSYITLKQDAVGVGRLRPRCRHQANWTKRASSLILALLLHHVKT